MTWAIGAASVTGFVITALFVLVAAGQIIKKVVNDVVAKMPKSTLFGGYATALASLCFFCLAVARTCYLATVLVDKMLGAPAVSTIIVSIGPMPP